MFSHLCGVRVAPLVTAAAASGWPNFIGALVIVIGLQGNFASPSAAFAGYDPGE